MTNEFTPGPWEARPNRTNLWWGVHEANGPAQICEVYNHAAAGANARLIAAAPDLLEALEYLRAAVAGIENYISYADDRESNPRLDAALSHLTEAGFTAQAALAKARGQTDA